MRSEATNMRLLKSLKRTELILGLFTVRGRRVLAYASPRGSQSASGEDKQGFSVNDNAVKGYETKRGG